MAEIKLSNLATRIITALILVPIVIGGLYAGYPFVPFMILALGALLSWEWAKMVPNQNPAAYASMYLLVTSFLIMLGIPGDLKMLAIVAGFLLICTLLVWVKSKEEPYRGFLTLGVPYVSIGIASIIWLYNIVWFPGLVWFLFVIWSVDVGGYAFGKTLKGPKLAPKISPNKTWAGLLGGMFLASLISFFLARYFGWRTPLNYALIAAGLAVIEQIGDLVESYIKRKLDVKDSSNIIPGHGGVFDRIDGLIFAAPILVLLLIFCENIFL